MGKRETHTEDGWEGYAEVYSITLEENDDGDIVASSDHRFMAHNDSNDDGTFEIKYSHILQRWLGPGPDDWENKGHDSETHTPECDVRETITHGTINAALSHVRETGPTNNPSGPQKWRVKCYTQVKPNAPIEGELVKAEYTKTVDFN